MLDLKRTIKAGTETAEGHIPHLYHNDILLPVRLDINNTQGVGKVMEYQHPVRDGGRLVYVLPGGESFCP